MIAVGWRERRQTTVAASLLVAAAALAMAPIALINTLNGGQLVLVTASGGLNLFGGNNPQSYPLGCTTFPIVYQVQTNIDRDSIEQPITQEHLAYRKVAEWLEGRKLSAKEASEVWERETVAYARRDPGAFLRGLAAKLRHFFNQYESHDTDSAYYRWQRFGRAPALFFAAVSAAAAIGLIARARAWRDYLPLHALALVYAFNCVLFYVSSRLRLPALLSVAVFAGLGIQTLVELFRARRLRPLAAALAAGAAVAAFCTWPTDATVAAERSMSAYVQHFYPATEAFLHGERARGLEGFATALAIVPESRKWIGDFLRPHGSDPLVAAFVTEHLSNQTPKPGAAPDPVEALRSRAEAQLLEGEYRSAIDNFAAVLAIRPFDANAYYSRAITEHMTGNWPQATRDLERAFEYGMKFEVGLDRLYFAIGNAAARAGDITKSQEFLRRSLFVNPAYRQARDLATSLANR
jgi:tetratricopeptide (TPR) repeat protein